MAISLNGKIVPLTALPKQKAVTDVKVLENGLKNLYTAKSEAATCASNSIDYNLVNRFVRKNIGKKGFNLEDFMAKNMQRTNQATKDAIRMQFATGRVGTPNLPVLSSKANTLPVVYKPTGTAPQPPKGFFGSLVDKLKAFAKTPKGKIGLAIAAATTAIGAASYLYVRNKDYGGPISDSSPINDLANMPAQGKINADGTYTVAKGDNLWCIARSILLQIHKDDKDYELTDVKIMQYMENIMQTNNLKYEEGSYKVVIQPNQSLKLTA